MRETYNCREQWQQENETDNEIITFNEAAAAPLRYYPRRIGVIMTLLISLLCGAIGLIIGAFLAPLVLISLPALLVYAAILVVLIIIVRIIYRR